MSQGPATKTSCRARLGAWILVLGCGLMDVATAEPPYPELMRRQVLAAGEESPPPPVVPLPPDFSPWWKERVQSAQRQHPARPVTLDELLVQALEQSPHVRAIRQTVPIRSQALIEQASEFDLRTFVDEQFSRSSDPVGDTLTTGGPPRLRDERWQSTAGVRKKTSYGGVASLSQRLGFRDNNSIFLNPRDQGSARLALTFTQPLLYGRGRDYNRGLIVLAEMDIAAAEDEVAAQLQEHLVEVSEAYWGLYLNAAVLEQKRRHFARGKEIADRLNDRRAIDALQSQILSAQAAVARRSADLNRAHTSVRNAESRIRALVNAPELFREGPLELVPLTDAKLEDHPIALRDALVTALDRRPDVHLAIQQIRMAGVRLEMSERELLPILNLVLETYVAGLQGQADFSRAWANQFTQGEPGYSVGLTFEVPVGNRAAQARYERRRLELERLHSQLQATMNMVMLEVEIAHRELATAYRDIHANFRTMQAAQAEVDYLYDRWTTLPGDDRVASLLLDDLLRSQDFLAESEQRFAEAQFDYATAQVRLKQAMGVLMAVSPAGDELDPGAGSESGDEEVRHPVHHLPPGNPPPPAPTTQPLPVLERLPPVR